MVDQEELDEDIFADLYDADTSANPSASVVKTVEEPSPANPPPADPAPASATESTANGRDNTHNVKAEPDTSGDAEMQGSAWNGNGNQSYDHAQVEVDDNYGPINVKEDGKMFIGGLNWETTEQSLKDYFSQFGEVSECTVMRDSASGRSRGFGFLTFKDPKCVNIVMVKEHYLDGKIIDPKRAIPREEQERTSKIFVGGVSQDATEQDFKDFFKQFGRVVDATLMMDKDTGRPRGFGFVTFDGDAAVDATLAGPLQILGKPIEVKRAQPRGNLRDGEEEKKFGRGAGGKFGSRNDGQGGFDQQNQAQNAGNGAMSPAMMAQYWQRMQQYFQMMQQQIAGAGMQNPGMGGMPAMNPAMMQQMMAMQGGMARPDGGSPQPQAQMGQMNPAMMQQQQPMQAMPQMQQMHMAQQQQPNAGYGGAAAAMPRPYSASDQVAFEQQKYEQQQQQARRMQQAGGYPPQGGPTSWEGMYDDIPQPAMPPQGPAANRMNQSFPRGGGPHSRGRQGSSQPPVQPSSAPPNAPTGPKNAGKPGANYRGGRGGHRGAGFHPYHRG